MSWSLINADGSAADEHQLENDYMSNIVLEFQSSLDETMYIIMVASLE